MKTPLQVSSKSSNEACAAKNRQFEIGFNADYDAYSKQVQTYEKNKTKAYTLLWERGAKAMKNKFESRSDYQQIKNDPFKLLKAIKEHALNY